MVKNIHRSSWKVPVILARFWRNLEILDRFSKTAQIPNFMKIHPVGAELFHVVKWTDRQRELIAAFRNFGETRLKKSVS
jgi:hypothetical protein